EQIVHERVVVQEQFGELATHRRSKPGVHHIDGKAALLSLEDPLWQITLTNLPVKPFPSVTTNFEIAAESLDILNHRPIQIGHSQFKTVRHGEFIGVHKQFIGKRGADLQQLKSTELVSVLHLRQERAPILHESITTGFRQQTFSKEFVYRWLRSQREDILITLQPILSSE